VLAQRLWVQRLWNAIASLTGARFALLLNRFRMNSGRSFQHKTPQTFTFASSPFWPIAMAFWSEQLLHLGWASSFGYSEGWPSVDRPWVCGGSGPALPVPHRGISDCGFDLVRCFFANAAPLTWRAWLSPCTASTGSRWPIAATSGSSSAPDGWMANRIFLHFVARNLLVLARAGRYSRHDYLSSV